MSDTGVSKAAMELLRACDVIDLHVDTFIPVRLWNYDITVDHGVGSLGGRCFGHLDLPRIREGGLTAAMWSITTNPFRSATSRWRTLERNLVALRAALDRPQDDLRIVRTARELRAAREAGAHACMISIQGGSALVSAPSGARSLPDDILRVTLVHLTNSVYGGTSSPLSLLRRWRGLSERGRDLVRELNERRIFVDLAHIHPDGFWDAVAVHDRSQPLIVTHTGVSGVRPHWRNLDDRQIKAIADTGGTIGIIHAAHFLRPRGGPTDGQMVVEHMRHAIEVVGEDCVSIGSDHDGMIIPPRDLRRRDCYARIVQHMLDRRWSETRILKILGGNFIRAFSMLRP